MLNCVDNKHTMRVEMPYNAFLETNSYYTLVICDALFMLV